MSERRTRSADSLLFEVLSGSESNLQSQLRSQLLNAMRTGRLSAGERLPSTRQLAADLRVARGTVVQVYDQLVQEGYLSAARGSGTVVTAQPQRRNERVPAKESSDRLFDLRPGAPDLRAFPRQQWAKASTHVVKTMSDADLGYVHPWGAEALRGQLAPYLARTRHVHTDPDDLVVTSGVTQGLTLMCRVLAQRGHRLLAFEDPSNPIQRQVLGSHGLTTVDVPVDSEGIVVEALRATAARAVLVTPAHQYPTGVVLSPQRRQALVAWATDVDGVILEDDYDAEFQFRSQPAPSLQAALPARVAHLSSVSKTLIPGARLGWVVVPPPLREELCTAKRNSDFGTDVLVQHTFARLLATGDYDRHVRRQRANYRAKRAALSSSLALHLPEWTIRGSEAGLHFWIEPPGPIDEVALVQAAEARGLLVLGMGSMCGAVRLPGLALGFARLSIHQAEHVALLLAETVKAVRHFRPGGGSGSATSALKSPGLRARLGATGVDFFALSPAASARADAGRRDLQTTDRNDAEEAGEDDEVSG